MPGTIARGREAIQAAQEAAKRGGSFRPFLKSIFWKEDKEEHYVLLLNEVDGPDGMPTFKMIQFIEDENGNFQEAVAKTDGFFGEKSDPFVEDWDATAVERTIAIAVELEPVYEVVKNRKKPVGFSVATDEYVRKVVDEDGEVTEEEEDVTTPIIGSIAQSPNNFFNHVEYYDANEAPINETAVKITRLGKDKNTAYDITGYDDQPIDLSNLFENLDGVSYLKEELDDIKEAIEGKDDMEAAQYIGQVILDKRIEELLDEDRYATLYEGTDESMDKFGNKKKGGKGKKKSSKTERPARTSQRRARQAEPEDAPEDEPAEESGDGSEVEEQPKAKAKARAKKAGRKASGGDRMAELRAKAQRKAA